MPTAFVLALLFVIWGYATPKTKERKRRLMFKIATVLAILPLIIYPPLIVAGWLAETYPDAFGALALPAFVALLVVGVVALAIRRHRRAKAALKASLS